MFGLFSSSLAWSTATTTLLTAALCSKRCPFTQATASERVAGTPKLVAAAVKRAVFKLVAAAVERSVFKLVAAAFERAVLKLELHSWSPP
jgi:hypothetical protein